MSWRWVDKRLLLILHDESLAEHGGASGLRDEGLLDSALARPLNLLAYGEPDAADLAAAYGLGLAKNHAFVDGNKRAAFLAVGLFLALNGHRLVASQPDATLDRDGACRRRHRRGRVRPLDPRQQRAPLSRYTPRARSALNRCANAAKRPASSASRTSRIRFT